MKNEYKTKIDAPEGALDIFITREFEIPIASLYKAYTDPQIIAHWMGTELVEFENKEAGKFHFQTRDNKGNIAFEAKGIIHKIIPLKQLVRTFESLNSPFDVQLEFIEFFELSSSSSKLKIQSIFRSNELRNQMLKLPFQFGLNWAHTNLENYFKTGNND